MSGTAKAFVVINLVLAVLVAGASATYLAQRNEDREALQTLQAKYDTETARLNGEVSRLEQESANLQNEVDRLSGLKARLETNLSSTEKDLELERKNRMELDAKLNAMADSLSGVKHAYDLLATHTESVSAELKAAKETAEAAVIAKEDAIDKMREAQMQRDAAVTQFRDTAKELHATRSDLTRYKALYPEPGGKHTPADIHGKVEEVDDGTGIVVISVGQDDGVARGMEFTVFRGEDGYVGKVVVTTVDRELSVARVDNSVSDKVKVGDNVSAAF